MLNLFQHLTCSVNYSLCLLVREMPQQVRHDGWYETPSLPGRAGVGLKPAHKYNHLTMA